MNIFKQKEKVKEKEQIVELFIIFIIVLWKFINVIEKTKINENKKKTQIDKIFIYIFTVFGWKFSLLSGLNLLQQFFNKK